jgi:hypothetical protein
MKLGPNGYNRAQQFQVYPVNGASADAQVDKALILHDRNLAWSVIGVSKFGFIASRMQTRA